MREIILTQGKKTMVDDSDYAALSRWNWFYTEGYAARKGRRSEGEMSSDTFFLHNQILNKSRDRNQVDHVNRNTLDNRRSNLRVCTFSENQANSGLRRDNTSGHRGVSWVKAKKRWRALIRINGKKKHLGYFLEKTQAVAAYREAALDSFGVFAN